MGKHKQLQCEYCSKEFRSDYLKKHILAKHSTPKKKKQNNIVVNKSPKKKNNFIVTEAEHSSESEREEIEIETEEDRNFINDDIFDESFEDPHENPYLDDVNDEVEERLKQLEERAIDSRLKELGCSFADAIHCIFCKTLFKQKDIKLHLKKCNLRIVECYVCRSNGQKKKLTYDELMSHLPQCKLDNRLRKRNEKRKKRKAEKTKEKINKTKEKKKTGKEKKKTGKPKEKKDKRTKEKKNKNKKDDKKKRKRKGTQFKLQKHGAVKYKIVKKLSVLDRTTCSPFITMPDWIKQLVIGNEFGSGPIPKPHTHMVLITKKPMTFEDLKKKIKDKSGLKFHDVQSCKDLKMEVRYVGKEDYRPVNFNFDWDLMNINVRAFIHAQKYEKLTAVQYPYCSLAPWQKKEFEAKFELHRANCDEGASMEMCPEEDLRRWQHQVLQILKYFPQDDRQIMWILDPVGNSGKSYLSRYLRLYHSACTTNGDSLRTVDFAYLYKGQSLVVVDFPRHTQPENMNYGLLEALKNGTLMSPKYQSRVLDFTHKRVQVVCLSNCEPDYTKLSSDRWKTMYIIEHRNNQIKLKRFVPELLQRN